MDEAGVESVAGGNALEHVHVVSRGEPVLPIQMERSTQEMLRTTEATFLQPYSAQIWRAIST